MIETVMRIFLDACGLGTPLTLECDDPGLPAAASSCHEHGLPFVIVGRDPGADLRINDPLISRRHAYLQVIAGRLFCIDLDSRSQIRWEGADNPAKTGWLEPEQFVWLGRYRIRWRGQLATGAEQAGILDPLSSGPIDRTDADQLPQAELELPIRIGENLSSWMISSRLSLIGRSTLCQLVLTDNSISTYHASLVRTPLGLWVVDLLSREGVWVNGTRVRWAWLDDGDTLRVGRFTFVLRYRSLPDRITRLDVPLDAGAILSASPVAATDNSTGVPVKSARTLALRSNQAVQSHAQLAPVSRAAPPLSRASRGGDEWSLVPEFGGGPAAMWNQHIHLLEMLHSEMILMVRMFMTMHREHVGSIRDELDRVQQLTRELETLQVKLGESSNAEKGTGAAGVENQRRETTPRLSAQEANGHRSPGSALGSPNESRAQRKAADPAGTSGIETAPPLPATDSSPRVEGESPPVDTVQFHAQITRRIAELQRERQGYWRKILNVMSVSAD